MVTAEMNREPGFSIQRAGLVERLVSHFRSRSVGAGGDQLKADGRLAVRTFRADRFFIDHVVVILLEPHQLKTLRTASYLRSHGLPFTLRLTDCHVRRD